jgi:hypothetical protein
LAGEYQPDTIECQASVNGNFMERSVIKLRKRSEPPTAAARNDGYTAAPLAKPKYRCLILERANFRTIFCGIQTTSFMVTLCGARLMALFITPIAIKRSVIYDASRQAFGELDDQI